MQYLHHSFPQFTAQVPICLRLQAASMYVSLLGPFIIPLRSPTGSVIGKSIPASISARKRYHPAIAATKPHAPPAYVTSFSECLSIGAWTKIKLTICKEAAEDPPCADWKKAPVRMVKVNVKKNSTRTSAMLVRRAQTVHMNEKSPMKRRKNAV